MCPKRCNNDIEMPATIDTVIVAMPDMYGRLIGKRVPAGIFCWMKC